MKILTSIVGAMVLAALLHGAEPAQNNWRLAVINRRINPVFSTEEPVKFHFRLTDAKDRACPREPLKIELLANGKVWRGTAVTDADGVIVVAVNASKPGAVRCLVELNKRVFAVGDAKVERFLNRFPAIRRQKTIRKVNNNEKNVVNRCNSNCSRVKRCGN